MGAAARGPSDVDAAEGLRHADVSGCYPARALEGELVGGCAIVGGGARDL